METIYKHKYVVDDTGILTVPNGNGNDIIVGLHVTGLEHGATIELLSCNNDVFQTFQMTNNEIMFTNTVEINWTDTSIKGFPIYLVRWRPIRFRMGHSCEVEVYETSLDDTTRRNFACSCDIKTFSLCGKQYHMGNNGEWAPIKLK
jgi:hypothetical protein